MVKNLPANSGNGGDVDLIPGSGKSILEEEMITHSSVLTWEISWTEELAGYSLWSHRVRHD